VPPARPRRCFRRTPACRCGRTLIFEGCCYATPRRFSSSRAPTPPHGWRQCRAALPPPAGAVALFSALLSQVISDFRRFSGDEAPRVRCCVSRLQRYASAAAPETRFADASSHARTTPPQQRRCLTPRGFRCAAAPRCHLLRRACLAAAADSSSLSRFTPRVTPLLRSPIYERLLPPRATPSPAADADFRRYRHLRDAPRHCRFACCMRSADATAPIC